MAFLRAAGERLEFLRHGPRPSEAPTLVFLHEGLGSVSTWRDFPARVADATGCSAFVFSRAGYGASDPVKLPRPVGYMHDDAAKLGEVLRVAGIERHVLIGHSDGASIALIQAGSTPSLGLLGVATLAPHVFCEDISVASIRAVRKTWETTDLRSKLARHHGANVDCAFLGWNGAWLDPDFRRWNIEAYLPKIAVPVLAIQGESDEYGTMAQVDTIARQAGRGAEVLKLAACGHAPHKDQPETTLAALVAFVKRVV